MTPLAVTHSTARRHRESIQHYGLLCHRPATLRPFGVYVYREDGELDHPTYGKAGGGRIRWSTAPPSDTWMVSYVGPLTQDAYVENGFILLQSVPPESVTLVTRN